MSTRSTSSDSQAAQARRNLQSLLDSLPSGPTDGNKLTPERLAAGHRAGGPLTFLLGGAQEGVVHPHAQVGVLEGDAAVGGSRERLTVGAVAENDLFGIHLTAVDDRTAMAPALRRDQLAQAWFSASSSSP